MSKETRKFKIEIEETINMHHEIEIPVSFLDEKLKEYIDDKKLYEEFLLDRVHTYYDKFIEQPNYKTKTITGVDFGFDTHVSVEEINDD
jgi:hypothetical protein